jgi:hypothetical protein
LTTLDHRADAHPRYLWQFFHAGLRDYCKENGLDEFDPGRWEEDYAAQPLIVQPGAATAIFSECESSS